MLARRLHIALRLRVALLCACLAGWTRGANTVPLAAKRASPVAWTTEEHAAFLAGVACLGRGHWAELARKFCPDRTAAQVASHAQKYYQRIARREDAGKADLATPSSMSLDSDSDQTARYGEELSSVLVTPACAAAAKTQRPDVGATAEWLSKPEPRPFSLTHVLAQSYGKMLIQALEQNGWTMPDAEEANALRVLATHLQTRKA